MKALDLVQQAQAGGWHIQPENGRLKLSGKKPMPAPLLNEFRTHRNEVLTFLTANEREERAAVAEHDGGLPREWAEGLATLNAMATPPDIPEGRWSRIIDNAARFADRWGRQAIDLGWSVRDVFGCHPTRPWKRIDQAGLVWLIGDHEVVAITDDTAVLMTPCGNRQTYYRRGQAGQTLIWQLGDQEPPCRRR